MAIVLASKTLPSLPINHQSSGTQSYPLSKRTQLELVASQTFSVEVRKADNSKFNLVTISRRGSKNVGYTLPLVGEIMQEVGHYGVIWGRLDKCQYFTKPNSAQAYSY